jgi:hypothetical protein
MTSSRFRRWDIVVGAAASVVAISGLLLSITLGNTAAMGVGPINRETQKCLLAVAGVFSVLIAIKVTVHHRRSSEACRCSLEAWCRRRRTER